MSFESEFLKPMEAEIDLKVRMTTKLAKIVTAEVAFNLINAKWPVWSGYSKANNRISINSPDQIVSPTERPKGSIQDIKGVLEGAADAENAAELGNLSPEGIKWNDTIHLGNGVSYAPDVGFQPGQGLHIYIESAREARSIAVDTVASARSRGATTPRFKGR